MGHGHLTIGRGVSASGARLGWRSRLRKGCGRRFQARQYNHGSVGSRNTLGRCAAGRQRNGSGSAARNLGRASGTPRRNASGESSGQQGPNSHRRAHLPSRSRSVPRRRTLACGHAADGIRRFFSTVLAVMIRREIRLAPRRLIAETTAVRPCVIRGDSYRMKDKPTE